MMTEKTVKSITIINWWNSWMQSSWFKIMLLIIMHISGFTDVTELL